MTTRLRPPPAPPTPPTTPATPVTRLAFVDNLRVALTALVVAHHVALAYGNLGMWPNWQQPASELAALPLDGFVLLNQAYFMGFFFLLAGFFVPPSADRRGAGGLVRGRLRRLAVPLLAALVVVRPLYALPEYLDRPLASRGSLWDFFLTNWNIGPLWFLGFLLVLSLAYAAVRAVRGATPSGGTGPTALRAASVLWFALALGLVSYAWRTVVPVGTTLLGIPSAAHLPQYVALFVVGVLAYRRGWLHALPRRVGLLGLGLAAASLVPMVLLDGAATLMSDDVPPADFAHLGFALWEAFFGLGAILVLVAVFRRHVTGSGPFARFLAGNAFAVYLVHAAVVVGIVAVLAPLDLPALVMFAVVLPLALAASWALAALVRRLPGARAVL